MEYYGDDSPIAALATGAGENALAIIRTSGKNCLQLLSSLFSNPQKLLSAPGNSVVLGWILSNPSPLSNEEGEAERVDQVLISVFRAPKSFTGEDCADISCHGGSATVNGVLSSLRAAGFRDSLRGEFTFRAFMNGKIGLTQVESVMEIVSSRTERSLQNAVKRLSGALEREISAIKEHLVEALAAVEIFLDYSEDEIPDNEDEKSGALPKKPLVQDCLQRLRELSASFHMERLYQDGASVVIAGRPNAGKSSLFNRLVKQDRSIVADAPGTTRDYIEAYIAVQGVPIRLVDTAGLRKTENAVERIGVEYTQNLTKSADVLIYVVDGVEGLTVEDRVFLDGVSSAQATEAEKVITVFNKADLLEQAGCLCVSAKTGQGLDDLAQAIVQALRVSGDESTTSVGIASVRQKDLIDSAVDCLSSALALSEKREPLDVIAPLVRTAIDALGEITGQVSTADILETMFSKFCVGK
ncbi:MAG: tRNA uridine-5-carboxymethylaminomethyl(34) synthesis GTPase MnmE [Treponema sp.]|jgi:tRNA modification GTPase|nr:tRNA uridine-5-carboxymethylaminomethyl(34) synthesis GTPase MnmE [Treponema sp.]